MTRIFDDVKRIPRIDGTVAAAQLSEIRATREPIGGTDIKAHITCNIGVKATPVAYC